MQCSHPPESFEITEVVDPVRSSYLDTTVRTLAMTCGMCGTVITYDVPQPDDRKDDDE